MMDLILTQLLQSRLLPEDLCTEIRHGITLPISELVMPLILAVLDSYIFVDNDPKSSWNSRRIARQNAAVAFLLALALYGAEPKDS
jgi:hypothetical protein